jgi:hypothetical protein
MSNLSADLHADKTWIDVSIHPLMKKHDPVKAIHGWTSYQLVYCEGFNLLGSQITTFNDSLLMVYNPPLLCSN